MAINKFLGNSIIKRLEETKFQSIEEIRERLKPSTEIGLGTWIDLSGLIAPSSEIDKLLNDIDNKDLNSLEDINKRFQDIHKNYYEYEWTWALKKIEEKLDKKYTEFTKSSNFANTSKHTKSSEFTKSTLSSLRILPTKTSFLPEISVASG